MNTLLKSRTTTFLAVIIFILTLNVDLSGAQETAADKKLIVELSDEEKAWLEKHPSIKLGFNPDMQPLLIQDAIGKNTGILPEIFAQLEGLTGLKVSIEVGPWQETIKKARQGEIDGLLNCVPALAEATGLLPTREFLGTIPVVFGKSDAPFKINSLDDLKGKRVTHLRAVKFIENILVSLGSETTALATDSFINALTMVLEGKADVALGMNFDTYILHQSVLTGIEPIFVDTSYVISAAAAVRSDWPELVGILNKALDTLGEANIKNIIKTWTQIETSIQPVDLTEAEKAWLKDHPVMRLGIDPSWAPVEYFDADGKLAGITSDNIRILWHRWNILMRMVSLPGSPLTIFESSRRKWAPASRCSGIYLGVRFCSRPGRVTSILSRRLSKVRSVPRIFCSPNPISNCRWLSPQEMTPRSSEEFKSCTAKSLPWSKAISRTIT
jgi:ABC-type amino acid transport substrate-binding protein